MLPKTVLSKTFDAFASGNKQKKEEIQFNKKYIFKTILKCFKILNI